MQGWWGTQAGETPPSPAHKSGSWLTPRSVIGFGVGHGIATPNAVMSADTRASSRARFSDSPML